MVISVQLTLCLRSGSLHQLKVQCAIYSRLYTDLYKRFPKCGLFVSPNLKQLALGSFATCHSLEENILQSVFFFFFHPVKLNVHLFYANRGENLAFFFFLQSKCFFFFNTEYRQPKSDAAWPLDGSERLFMIVGIN